MGARRFPRRPAPPTFSQPQPQPLWLPSFLLSSQYRSRKLRKRFLFPSPCPLCLPPSSDLMRILDSNNIEFGAEPSEVVDVAKLTVENSSAIKFFEVYMTILKVCLFQIKRQGLPRL